MSEGYRNPHESSLSTERKELLTRIAQGPVTFLRPGIAKGKTCGDCIDVLKDARTQIGQWLGSDTSQSIEKSDAAFKKFYMFSNSALEHFSGLFSILKDSGFDRQDIATAIMDQSLTLADTPEQQRSKAMREFFKITNQALDEIFGSQA